MKNTNILGIVVGLAGVAYGLYCQSRMNTVANKLNTAIDDIDKNLDVDIPEAIVTESMQRAVNREVSFIAHKAAVSTSSEITSRMQSEVKREIESRYQDLSEMVSEEISTDIAKIDVDVLRTKIVKKAEQKMLDKLDGSMDGILDKFNGELRSVSKIYSSIADTIGNREREEKKSVYLNI